MDITSLIEQNIDVNANNYGDQRQVYQSPNFVYYQWEQSLRMFHDLHSGQEIIQIIYRYVSTAI